MALIAVDLDGTLVNGSAAITGAREAMNILREHGHKIMIFSCNGVDWVKKVLANNDIRYDSIYGDTYKDGKKPICDLYIDDRGYHFKGDWIGELHTILKRVENKL